MYKYAEVRTRSSGAIGIGWCNRSDKKENKKNEEKKTAQACVPRGLHKLLYSRLAGGKGQVALKKKKSKKFNEIQRIPYELS